MIFLKKNRKKIAKLKTLLYICSDLKKRNERDEYLNCLFSFVESKTHTIVFQSILQRAPAQIQFVRAVEDVIGLWNRQWSDTYS